MSATGRSPVRLAQDVYPIPSYCVDKLLPWLDLNGRDGEPLTFFYYLSTPGSPGTDAASSSASRCCSVRYAPQRVSAARYQNVFFPVRASGVGASRTIGSRSGPGPPWLWRTLSAYGDQLG